MHHDEHIDVREITRVEGHGNIVIDIKKGRIKELRLEIIESPRFFEKMLVGRKYDEAHHVMSRICGICAISHTSASLKAIESAMGIKVAKRSRLLRRLAFCGETIQSHILHLYFLVLPDLFKVDSLVPLIKLHPEAARLGLKLKAVANEICHIVGGRHVHPISLVPGGVAHTPEVRELRRLRGTLEDSLEMLDETISLFSAFEWPKFSRDREFISLRPAHGYPSYEGEPFSSILGDGLTTDSYAKMIKEYIVPHSSAKHARTRHGTFMVGALARLNNNRRRIRPLARSAAKRLGVKLPCNNPFFNNPAQLIESVHLTEEAIEIIDNLLEAGVKTEPPKKPTSYGTGIGIVEAPRGTLYHEYEIGKDGLVKRANCIIPTAQNLRSIEDDLKSIVPTLLDKTKEEITATVESLVRAYDPCISCSTHMMDVRFV